MAKKTKKSPEKRQLTLSSMLKRKRGTGQLDTEELDHFLNSQTLAESENENQTITIQSENDENELNLEPATSNNEADEQTIEEKLDEVFDDDITDPDFQLQNSDDDESELETADESEIEVSISAKFLKVIKINFKLNLRNFGKIILCDRHFIPRTVWK